MNSIPQTAARIVPEAGGRPISGFIGMLSKIPTETFDGRLFALAGTIQPGEFIPPHTHSREDEATYIVDGELSFDLGGMVSIARAGDFALKPRGVYHSFWNHTDTPTSVLEFHTPGLMEPYYEALGSLFRATDVSEVERQDAISKLHLAYGIVYHPDLAEGLMAAHGIRLGQAPREEA